jgi:hypothetical protein
MKPIILYNKSTKKILQENEPEATWEAEVGRITV